MAVREEWEPYVVAWRERRQRQREALVRRAEAGREAARTCAQVLVEEYGAGRVWLFGSLVHRRRLHERTDIDLAVEGLPPVDYFRALTVIWELLPQGFELDLVPLEDARPGLVDLVRKEGELLYGRA